MPISQFRASRFPRRLRGMLACLLGAALTLLARASDEGLPILRAFSPTDYQNIYQMFSGVQSPDGIVNFGGYAGVVRFDGNAWTSITVDGSAIRGLTIGPDGLVYVAGDDFFGRLEAAATGALQYRSLLTELEGQPVKVPGTRTLASSAEGVFAGTALGVLQRLPDGTLKRYPLSTSGRNRVFRLGDKIINYSVAEGLHSFANGQWTPLSSAAPLKVEGLHFLAEPLVQGDIAFFGMTGSGLYRITAQGEAIPLVTAADEALKGRQFLSACVRRDGSIMIGTTDAGAFWISSDRQRFRHFPPSTVLPSPTISSMFEDREGGIWMTTYNGIVRLDPDTPATVFDQRNGLGTGVIGTMVRHEGQLFMVYNSTLIRLTPSEKPGAPARFVRDDRLPSNFPVSGAISHPSGLVLTTLRGISLLRGDK
ncbi:MAG: two-component regulator propeller domain-containing protein, partial [Verrucomicrobiota bacterium]